MLRMAGARPKAPRTPAKDLVVPLLDAAKRLDAADVDQKVGRQQPQVQRSQKALAAGEITRIAIARSEG